MRSVVSVLVVLLAFAPGLLAAEVWVPLAGEAGDGVRVDLVQSSEQGVELEVALPGFTLAKVETEAGAFTTLKIADLGAAGEPGEPELPVLNRFVEIPIGTQVSVDAQALDPVTVDLAGRGLAPALYPAQLPRPKCGGEEAQSWRFSFNPKAYHGTVERETASASGPFTMRDHTLVTLAMSPVRYDADAGTLEVASRLRVRVAFTGGDLAATRARKQRLASRHFDAVLDHATLNLNFGGKAAGWHYPADAPVEFLIIAPNDAAMLTALEPFVVWKTSCGFHVDLVTTAVTGTTTTAIKSYIQGLYGGANPPVYILMIGDSPTPLVTFTNSGGGSGGTDLPYVQMDSDLYPDMIIARWPVDDANELIAMRDKILVYEQPTVDNSAWLNRALFMEGSGYQGAGVTTHADVIAQLMDPPPNANENTRWLETANHSVADLIAYLNTGGAWAVYSAHSGPDGWSGPPPLSSGDFASFTNLNKYPLGFGHSCQSNMWNSYGDVFGEVAVTTANKGFVSYWGGSNSTYWDGDDWLERGFFDSMFDADMTGNLSPMDRQYSQGAACYAGQTQVTVSNQSNEQYYWYLYNLDGDPTLDPFTKRPVGVTIGVDPVMPPAATDTFTVTVSDGVVGAVPGALVGVSQGGVLLGAGYSDDTGTAVFHVDAPQAGTDVLVRVTAHNHVPADASVMAGAGSDGVVVLDHSLYRCDSTVTIDVFDDDLAGQGTLNVTLAAAPSGGSTTVQLTEQGGGVVRFRGTATLGVNLTVAHGDTLTVTYHDQNTGGGSAEDKVDTAAIDCAGPVITDLAASDVGAESAVITWATDEPGTSVAVASPGGATASNGDLVTSHSLLLGGLDQCTNYSVDVSSADGLGNIGYGGPVSFQTLQQTVALDDDVESGNIGWTVDTAIGGGTNWSIVADGTANHAWFSSDVGAVKDDRLVAGPFTLGGGTTTLAFDHHYNFESSWDGGVVEVSTNGSSWQDVITAGGVFVSGGYSGTLNSSGNPIGGRSAWTGTGSGQVELDLSALSGNNLWFRFRLGCDGSVSAVGWYVDNILLETTSACSGMVFSDDFECGSCAHWTVEVP